jgi:hypothetical protein
MQKIPPLRPIEPEGGKPDANTTPESSPQVKNLSARGFDPDKIYPTAQEPGLIAETSSVTVKKSRRRFKKTKRLIFLILLVIMSVTFFTRNDYRSISSINNESKFAPKQTATDAQPFNYEFNGVNYKVTPLYNYELSGMVVSRLDYEKSYDAKNSADDLLFPTDLCMIWANNLTSGIYKKRSTTFSQGGRWCVWSWQEAPGVINEDVANNHLMFTNPDVKKKIKNIKPGDQVKITGKLIDVQTATPDAPANKIVRRHSSIVRTDTGGASCEDIWVEDLVILQKNLNISQKLFIGSLAGLGLIMVWTTVSWSLSFRKDDL